MDLAHVLAHGLAHCLSPYLKGGAPMQFVPSCTLSVPKVGPPGVDVVSDTLCLASYNFDSHIWRGRETTSCDAQPTVYNVLKNATYQLEEDGQNSP